jgi:UDP:flavonoid glycosyltransferase YjiC (YdhE family)
VGEIALLTWDGGGNVSVAVAIAVALGARGHSVSVVGPRSLQRVVERLGIGYAELGILPPRDPRGRLEYLLGVAQGSDAMLAQLRRLVVRADALVIDCNLSWALQSPLARRTAVLVHTALGLYLPVWQAVLDMANAPRTARGLVPLAAAADAWARSDLLRVASLAQFDRPLPTGRLRPVYVGPVSARRGWQAGPLPIGPAGERPRVLISFSTDSLQNSARRLQTALDALDGLPVTVLASASGAFDPSRLRVPANATVLDYLPHDSVMPTVVLVVCHAGHGTTMAAVTRGVPLVCVPGLGRDQEPIAARVSELGLGVALRRDASAEMIRDAARTVLADDGYRGRARDFARTAQPDGAQRAADPTAHAARRTRSRLKRARSTVKARAQQARKRRACCRPRTTAVARQVCAWQPRRHSTSPLSELEIVIALVREMLASVR